MERDWRIQVVRRPPRNRGSWFASGQMAVAAVLLCDRLLQTVSMPRNSQQPRPALVPRPVPRPNSTAASAQPQLQGGQCPTATARQPVPRQNHTATRAPPKPHSATARRPVPSPNCTQAAAAAVTLQPAAAGILIWLGRGGGRPAPPKFHPLPPPLPAQSQDC
jgi:hypothetical protein